MYIGIVSLLLIENERLELQLVNKEEDLYQTREQAEGTTTSGMNSVTDIMYGYYRLEEDVFRNDTGTRETEGRIKEY